MKKAPVFLHVFMVIALSGATGILGALLGLRYGGPRRWQRMLTGALLAMLLFQLALWSLGL